MKLANKRTLTLCWKAFINLSIHRYVRLAYFHVLRRRNLEGYILAGEMWCEVLCCILQKCFILSLSYKGNVGLGYVKMAWCFDRHQTNSPLVPVLEPIFTQELILFKKKFSVGIKMAALNTARPFRGITCLTDRIFHRRSSCPYLNKTAVLLQSSSKTCSFVLYKDAALYTVKLYCN